jgi:hypothetical protein
MIVTPKRLKTLINATLLFGVIFSLFYLVILGLYYNDIGILEAHRVNNDDIISLNDLPLGLFLTIEIIASLVLAFGSASFFLALKNKNTRYAIAIVLFFTLGAYASTGTYRVLMIWGENEGQCKYANVDDYIKACPTTRHVNTKPANGDFWKLERVEPTLESDCIFWFWDKTFTLSVARSTYNNNITLHNEMIENMDWSQKHLYGFYDVESRCEKGTDCVPDGRTIPLVIQQKAYAKKLIKKPIANNTVPDISFCYYWGCSEVCNEDRFRVNRVLMYGGMVTTAISFVLFAAGVSLASGTPEGFDSSKKSAEDTVTNYEEELMKTWQPMTVKSMNRRRLRF